MSEDDLGRAVEAQLIAFFLALPDPLPFPHGGTVTFFLEDEIPGLQGIELRVASDAPAIPLSQSGRQFVSLKFWQVESPRSKGTISIDAVDKVMREVLPGNLFAAGDTATPPPEELAQGVVTVVEMVTLVRPDQGGDWISEAFDRCLESVQDLARSYRMQVRAQIPQLSYERLPFYVPWALRNLGPTGDWEGISMLVLHYNIEDPPASASGVTRK